VTAAAAIVVDAPAGVAAKARYALEELARMSGASAPVAYPSSVLPASEAAWRLFSGDDATAPRPGGDGLLDFGDGVDDLVMSAFWHLSRWEEGPGSARDERGRFPGSAALFDPEEAAADALVDRFRGLAGGHPPGPLMVALSHDIDTPWRWSGIRAVAGAAARAKAAALGRRPRELARELRGLAGLPRHRARGTDPNWCFERMAEIERSHDGRSTYFVLAGHHHPADSAAPAVYERVRPAVVTQVLAQGDELGLHPSYTASERHELIAAERALLEGLAGGPVRGVRFHYLRYDAHTTLPALERLGFGYDSSQGYADRPGMRAGLSFPYRPYDVAADRPLELLELPLVVMDANLAEERYLGLDAGAGLDRAVATLERAARAGGTVSVLWHNDRFDPAYARGWDRAYDRLLEWVRERGGRLTTAAEAVGLPGATTPRP
jgi:peptidoglycan/xylan/chitin deacetylase (PgdA/CDA1 family)